MYSSQGVHFSNAKKFKESVRNYIIKNGRKERFIDNEPNKLRVVCPKDCDWLIYTSKV